MRKYASDILLATITTEPNRFSKNYFQIIYFVIVMNTSDNSHGPEPIHRSGDGLRDRRFRSEQLELIEIGYGLASRWRTILLLTTCGLIFVVAYLMFKPVVYEASVSSLPPQEDKIQALRFPMLIASQESPRSKAMYWVPTLPRIPEINVDNIFDVFQNKLTSPGLQRRYIQKHVIPTDFYVSKNTGTLTLIIHYEQRDQAIKWVEGFSQYASQVAILEIASHLQHVINNRVKIIEHAISSIRNLNDQYRLDRLERLKQALYIARKLKIIDRIVETPLRPEDVPLYYQGINMLSAELEAIQIRPTNDSFNTLQLRELREWRDQLRSVSIKTDDIQAASFYEASVQRIKTNSTRLIGLGIILGLVAGVTLAFLSVLAEQYRKMLESD